MNNKEFDDIIKEQLSNLDNHSKGTWGQMKSQFENEFDISDGAPPTDDIDKEIKSSLDGYEIPFNESHQMEFLDQYGNYLKNKRKVLFNVISRVAIVLLLLFSGINLYNNHSYNLDSTEHIVSSESSVGEQSHNNGEHSLLVNDKSAPSIVQNELSTSEQMSQSVNQHLSQNQEPSILESSDISTSGIAKLSERTFAFIGMKKNTIIEQESMPQLTSWSSGHMNTEHREARNKKVENIESLASLVMPILENGEQSINMDKMYENIDFTEKPNSSLTIGAWSSLDIDKNYDYTADMATANASTGLSVSKRIGKFEIETGVAYGRVKFDPSTNDTYFGSYKKLNSLKLKNVDLVVTSIPITAKYHVDIDDKTSFYSTVEAKYNAVLVNNSKTNVAKNISVRSFADIESRKMPSIAGALEGGGLLDNSFITASVGLGIERTIGQHAIAFLEPSFETQIKPINLLTTNDNLRGFNLRFGVKKSI